MAKRQGGKYCTVDHANKMADRQRKNPNRRLLQLRRASIGVPDACMVDGDDAGKSTKDPK
ncbi:MAG: hypothetical protein QNJ05_09175 [Woeseiaceae bacterium]|nr:hypothetical protein [Woeseiaceae bacterium]